MGAERTPRRVEIPVQIHSIAVEDTANIASVLTPQSLPKSNIAQNTSPLIENTANTLYVHSIFF